jgi:hypothetical protein
MQPRPTSFANSGSHVKLGLGRGNRGLAAFADLAADSGVGTLLIVPVPSSAGAAGTWPAAPVAVLELGVFTARMLVLLGVAVMAGAPKPVNEVVPVAAGNGVGVGVGSEDTGWTWVGAVTT